MPTPTVTSVTPREGVLVGGTAVTVAGTNFDAGTTFTFGGRAATSVSVAGGGLSATMVTPLHTSGFVDIIATRSTLETGTLTDGFFYYVTPHLEETPPWQTAGQWALHEFSMSIRREGDA